MIKTLFKILFYPEDRLYADTLIRVMESISGVTEAASMGLGLVVPKDIEFRFKAISYFRPTVGKELYKFLQKLLECQEN